MTITMITRDHETERQEGSIKPYLHSLEQAGHRTIRIWLVSQEVLLLLWPLHLRYQVRSECRQLHLRQGLQEDLQDTHQRHHCSHCLLLRSSLWISDILPHLVSDTAEEGANIFTKTHLTRDYVEDTFPERSSAEKVCICFLWRDFRLSDSRREACLLRGEDRPGHAQHQPQRGLPPQGLTLFASQIRGKY